MYCSNCGNESNKKICSACGVKQNKSKKYCIWCGSELQLGASMCTNCQEKTAKTTFGSIIVTLISLLLMFLFIAALIGTSDYSTPLIMASSIIGFVASLPVWYSFIRKKTHGKKALRGLLQFVRVVGCFALFVVILMVFSPMGEYDLAVRTAVNDPIEARELFVKLDGYKDSEEQIAKIDEIIFNDAKSALENADWKSAEKLLAVIPEYTGVDEIKPELLYQKGVDALNNYNYPTAKDCFNEIGDYKDVSELRQNIGIGLCGNDYNCTLTSYSPLRVSSYNLYFRSYAHDGSKSVVHEFAGHTPKLYIGGIDMDASFNLQYRIIDGVFYGCSEKIDFPENPEDCSSVKPLYNINWENGEITGFSFGDIYYTLDED